MLVMRSRVLLLSAALIAFSFDARAVDGKPSATAPAASGMDVTTRTRALFRKGLAAYNSGRVEAARRLFLEAWTLRQSADVAMQLAQTEMDLGLYVDAAEHLDFALNNFTPSINERMRSIAKQAHVEVLRRVTRLRVSVNQDGADVLVNGRMIGRSPLPGPIYAEAGNCVAQAVMGADVAVRTLSAEPGKEISVHLVLPSLAPAPSATPTTDAQRIEGPQPSAPTHDSTRSAVPLVLGGTLAIVGVAMGVGLKLAANADENEANRLAANLGSSGCDGTGADSALCRASSDARQKAARESDWSTASLVFGSAALVATAAYWFWPRKAKDQSSRPVVSGCLAPGAAGLGLWGSF